MAKKILFLCKNNSCRSQMAEGIAKSLLGSDFEIYSAGIEPTFVNPYAIKVMAEINIDISENKSKHLDSLKDVFFEDIITVCDIYSDSCPIFHNGKNILHWNFSDPANAKGTKEEKFKIFRQIRDEIKSKIQEHYKGGL